MAESAEFSPSELDRLEDALEALEATGLPADLLEPGGPPTDAVAKRLSEYREVLQLSREALPLHDVRPGVLDAVLQQAHADAPIVDAPKAAAAPGFWRRFRRSFLLPALALAGSTALLLYWIRPDQDREVGQALDGPVAQLSPEKDAPAAAHAEPTDEVEGSARLQAQAQPLEEPETLEPEAVSELEAAPDDADAEDDGVRRIRSRDPGKFEVSQKSGRADNSGPLPSGGKKARKGKARPAPAKPTADPKPASPSKKQSKRPSLPGSTPAPEPVAGGADDGPGARDAKADLRRGDGQRRAGNCGLARLSYDRWRAAADLEVRALALAGLGLCEELAGRSAAAGSLYRQAKSADRRVASFIAREQAAMKPAQQQVDQAANAAEADEP